MANNDAKRVIKNTISLYIRMIILTLISLVTVRVVLSVLGEEDYGLYNVVAGFVSMFSFISGTLTIASQRYFSICLSSNDWDKLRKLFSINFTIYVVLSIVVFIIAESVGLWVVANVLDIPNDRLHAAILVYQFSIINFIIVLMVSPFLALLVADENLSIYSIVSIVEGILKVLVIYLLYTSSKDKLVVYAFLLCLVSLMINSFYVFYCVRKYKQLKIHLYTDKEDYKNIFSFLNWNLIGAVASVAKAQGVNMILNIFFGSLVNAARAIAFQVSNVISSFSQNFMKAINPQITKKYVIGNKDEWLNIIYIASKISYFLLFIISIPLIMNMEYVFVLWLGNIPKYTIKFAILVLIDSLILAITDPLFTAVQSIGKVKFYQILVGGVNLLNLPLSILMLKIYDDPIIPFVIAIIVSLLINIGRMISFRRAYEYSVLKYCLKVYVPILLTSTVAIFINYFYLGGANTLPKLIANCILSVLVSVASIFVFGMSKKEKSMLLKMIKREKV